MRLPRFITKLIPNYSVTDVKEWRNKGEVHIYLKKDLSAEVTPQCSRCGNELKESYGKYQIKLKHLPIFNFKVFLFLWREKRRCPHCKKVRSEKLDFISPETPHLTREYSWWLGRLCEISSVSEASRFTGNDPSTVWRLDFARLKRMFQNYEIPKVTRISVDEVYARRKKRGKKESRDKRFFTIVSDLTTRKVIWVSESRSKEALDEFFRAIGEERCKEIEVVAGDQHQAYLASTKEFCPNATFVWDRFHLVQTFEQFLNDDRAWLHRHLCTGELKRLTRGKFKGLFLKKAERRTPIENRHLKDVLKDNEEFAYLEIIKEGFFSVFESEDEFEAREKFVQIGEWIRSRPHFYELKKWWENFDKGWETFKNYFTYRVSSSLSEGINNVIKTVKKRGYGYKNMPYFKLKILQVCGFLNSRYVPSSF